MRGLTLALLLALSAAMVRDTAAAEVGVVYVQANVGGASGGHAALVADQTVYHLQTDGDGLYRIARDGWSHFSYVYAGLQNRPLEIAHLELAPETRDDLLDRFARLYVEQDIEQTRRDALRDDVAWLKAWEKRLPLPPLRGAGLLDPEQPGDLDAARLRDAVRAELDAAQRAFAVPPREGEAEDLAALRERLALGEALRALEGAWGVASAAVVDTPPRFDDPLSAQERASLHALAVELERSLAQLLGSSRPDRGYALLLAQARYTVLRRSLAQDRLILLDAFDGHGGGDLSAAELPSAHARAEQLEYAGDLLRRGRKVVLASGRLDESTYNLLEEAGALLERTAQGRADTALLDLDRRKLPARARVVAAPPYAGDVKAALVAARRRLAGADARYREHWSYDLIRRNCITELARTADEALGGRVPADELFGFIPFVFFDRVVERAPAERVEHVPAHRASELARLEREESGVWMRLRESTALGSTIYTPRLRDGAFLLFTDDVFWRRPLYGAANLVFAAGYTAYGVAAAPFDRGVRARSGLSGMFWSVPELAFQNVRKGTFEWVTTAEDPR